MTPADQEKQCNQWERCTTLAVVKSSNIPGPWSNSMWTWWITFIVLFWLSVPTDDGIHAIGVNWLCITQQKGIIVTMDEDKLIMLQKVNNNFWILWFGESNWLLMSNQISPFYWYCCTFICLFENKAMHWSKDELYQTPMCDDNTSDSENWRNAARSRWETIAGINLTAE